jgi:hypothetical protein
MPASLTPRAFALNNLLVVRRLWRGVHDADQASIHEARIALRPVRAALGVMVAPDAAEIELCRAAGAERAHA